jgi:hypothetical protein
MMNVKILFARGKYGWGPSETGEWITYLAATRVIILVAIVPLIVRFLRKAPPQPLEPRPEIDLDNIQTAQAALRWDAEAAKLKKAADTGKSLVSSRIEVVKVPRSLGETFSLGYSFRSFNRTLVLLPHDDWILRHFHPFLDIPQLFTRFRHDESRCSPSTRPSISRSRDQFAR